MEYGRLVQSDAFGSAVIWDALDDRFWPKADIRRIGQERLAATMIVKLEGWQTRPVSTGGPPAI